MENCCSMQVSIYCGWLQLQWVLSFDISCSGKAFFGPFRQILNLKIPVLIINLSSFCTCTCISCRLLPSYSLLQSVSYFLMWGCVREGAVNMKKDCRGLVHDSFDFAFHVEMKWKLVTSATVRDTVSAVLCLWRDISCLQIKSDWCSSVSNYLNRYSLMVSMESDQPKYYSQVKIHLSCILGSIYNSLEKNLLCFYE